MIGIAGISVASIVLYSSTPPSQHRNYLILAEATFSLSILMDAIIFYITWKRGYFNPYRDELILFTILGLIVCAVGMTALAVKPPSNDKNQHAVYGLLWTVVILQACLPVIFMTFRWVSDYTESLPSMKLTNDRASPAAF